MMIKGYTDEKIYLVRWLSAPKIFAISSDKLDKKKNIGKIFWRYSSEAHLPPALQDLRKDPPEVFCKKCSLNFLKIHRKTPVPESVLPLPGCSLQLY